MKWTSLFLTLSSAVFLPSLTHAEIARATIRSTGTTPVAGKAYFQDTPDGLRIIIEFTQAPPGNHGLAIHEYGTCDDEGKATGWHYNPLSNPHGDTMADGAKRVHPGDFGNIYIGPDGHASLRTTLRDVTLTHGNLSIVGRALVLREKPDDFSQPTGNAGGRIGCGPILIKEQ